MRTRLRWPGLFFLFILVNLKRFASDSNSTYSFPVLSGSGLYPIWICYPIFLRASHRIRTQVLRQLGSGKTATPIYTVCPGATDSFSQNINNPSCTIQGSEIYFCTF
jgi:hypothetical protein